MLAADPPDAARPASAAGSAHSLPAGRTGRLARVVALGGVLLFVVGNPWLSWPCPLASLLHVPCPTCGMTRASLRLFALDFAGAARLHPLVFVTLPLLVAVVALEAHGYVQSAQWGAATRRRSVSIALTLFLVAHLALWLARFLGAFGGPVPL
jgi:hypothetical protein